MLLKKPVPLTPDAGRILFESMREKLSNSGGQLRILPVIGDSSGEKLRYTPVPFPVLSQKTGNWKLDSRP